MSHEESLGGLSEVPNEEAIRMMENYMPGITGIEDDEIDELIGWMKDANYI